MKTMIIFPLSPAERVVFVLIMLIIIAIFTMLQWPQWWSKLLRRENKSQNIEHAKVDKKKLKQFAKKNGK